MIRKKALLQDNSWIKKGVEEDEPVDDDPNYGRDVLGGLKTRSGTESKPADVKQSSTAKVNTSVSVTKRVSETQSLTNKSTSPTATKPPVPEKKTALSTQSNKFTARVFSGANSGEKVLSPVKKSLDEKFPDPPKEVPDGTESKTKITPPAPPAPPAPAAPAPPAPAAPPPPPPTTSVMSIRKSTETYTSPERTYTSFTSKTETYSKNPEQSYALNSLADDLIPSFSPTVQTKPASPLKSPLDMSYNTYQQVNTTETIIRSPVQLTSHVSQTLHSPVNPAPSTASRIVGKRDLCSFCAKSIVEGERIILDDLQIFSHTFCFKCDMCYKALGNLAAGDTLWVHKGRVTCDKCYIKTKDQWYR